MRAGDKNEKFVLFYFSLLKKKALIDYIVLARRDSHGPSRYARAVAGRSSMHMPMGMLLMLACPAFPEW
jgi:hypothetical protein